MSIEKKESVRKFSRRIGASHVSVLKAIETGRLSECVCRVGGKIQIDVETGLKEVEEINFNFKKIIHPDFRENKDCTDIIISMDKYIVWSDKHKLDEDGFIKLYHMLMLYRACLLNPEPVTEFTRYNLLKFVTDLNVYHYFQSGIYSLYSALEEEGYKEPVKEMDMINKDLAVEIKTHYPGVDISRLKDIKILKAYFS